MSFLPPGALVALTLSITSAVPATALEVRGYTQAKHNRLLEFPGEPIIPGWTVHVNPTFSPDASLFLGIGWPAHPTDWTRQMALVSPRHFVYASHYPLGSDWQIAFLGSDVQQHKLGIVSQVPIINSQGQPTDLMLCTLTGDVPANLGISPFPVLNLATEAEYVGRQMVVNGSFVRAGKMPIAGFTTLVNDPGFDTTRFAYFDYNKTTGGPNDCNYQGGDSGAPSFVMVNGKPAIVGTASGMDDLPNNISRCYVAAIRSYLPQLDALMEPQGYHMIRFYPTATAVSTHIDTKGALRQMKPGGVTITTHNNGTAVAHNVSLQLTFSHPPTSVSGSGWICEAAAPLVWNCHRGGMAAATDAPLTASWTALPKTAAIQISAAKSYDGGTPETTSTTLPLIESFTSWIQGAGSTDENADPDGDGIPNLLEYAFGGAPQLASPLTTYGFQQLPQMERSGNNLLVHFPFRTDAAVRGLTDSVEFSSGLAPDSWDTSQPAGTTIQNSSFTPAVPGFEEVTVCLPMDVAKRFVRVKVSLSE